MGLRKYRAKRNLRVTPEPAARPMGKGRSRNGAQNIYVIHKHDASHLHYDLRLELGGTLKSWAIPKGPSYDPAQKRLAIQVEDHPVDYASFEGSIPKGEYGGGEVIVWDTGNWSSDGEPREDYRNGHLHLTLSGKKMRGSWDLFRIRGQGERAQWLLVKRRDRFAHATPDPNPIVDARPESVLSKRLLARDRVDPPRKKKSPLADRSASSSRN